MTCLKCGRETDQTFCESCREVMERYPVKPGTIVQLPKDRSAAYTRRSQSWRTMVTPEMQIENQKQTIRRLTVVVFVLSILLLIAGFALFRALGRSGQPPVGQNYSTVTKNTESVTDPTIGTEAGAVG